MEHKEIKAHWNKIYSKRSAENVGWYQPNPIPSIKMIETSGFDKNIKIIDIGGGDCYLAEHLLDLGFKNISVLEISEVAIERAKKRMEEKAEQINWICSNILDFDPSEKYDLWHDRAVFHFLTDIKDIRKYKKIAFKAIAEKGRMMLATFSELGPDSCSGLPVTQYSESNLYKLFSPEFHMVRWQYYDHKTPSKTKQNYIYSCFSKVN